MSRQSYQDLAIDQLPTIRASGKGKSGVLEGKWAGSIQPGDSSWFQSSGMFGDSHLQAFENTVKELKNGSHFASDAYLFVNMLGVRESSISETRSAIGVMLSELRSLLNRWSFTRGWLDFSNSYTRLIRAGRTYDLVLYHYFPPLAANVDWPSFQIDVNGNNSDISFLNQSSHMVEAEYDEVRFKFTVPDTYASKTIGLTVLATSKAEDPPKTLLRADLDIPVQRPIIGRLIQMVVVAAGLVGGQAIALETRNLLDKGSFALIFGFALIAAWGIVFRVGRK